MIKGHSTTKEAENRGPGNEVGSPQVTRGPFWESPENFLSPKSHLWNCQPLIWESQTFNLFSS